MTEILKDEKTYTIVYHEKESDYRIERQLNNTLKN